MSKSRIDVKTLKERTVIVMSRLRDITDISLKVFIDTFYVFTDKIKDIEKESVLKKNIFEKLEYS